MGEQVMRSAKELAAMPIEDRREILEAAASRAVAAGEYSKAERGALGAGEPHPAALGAHAWIAARPLADLLRWQESFSSCAIEGDRLAEVCAETLRRLLSGEPVSDRYLLGLVWAVREMSFVPRRVSK